MGGFGDTTTASVRPLMMPSLGCNAIVDEKAIENYDDVHRYER